MRDIGAKRALVILGVLCGVTCFAPPTVLATGGEGLRAIGAYAASGSIIAEEVASTNANAWQAAGITGTGVKLAVVDVGFGGYAALQTAGVLPGSVMTANFCRGGLTADSTHGSAVAEVVHRMAPAASLYLVCAVPGEGLAAAVRYLRSQRVQVVASSSIYAVRGRRDHRGRPAPGSPDGIVGDARAHGITWVNAAGNYAAAHWAGSPHFDRRGYLRFTHESTSERVYASGGGNVVVRLISSGSNPARRYRVLMIDRHGRNVARFYGRRVQGEAPSATFFVSDPKDGPYRLRLRRIRGPADRRLELFFQEAEIAHPVPAGSIPELADAPDGLAVGAVCWARQGRIEFYSSLGRSIYGQIKPDLVAPDNMSTVTYGASHGCHDGFSGTSASASVVAGAAALILQRYPGYGPSQLGSFLQNRAAVHLGPRGKNNTYGAGVLRLPSPGG